MRSLIDTTLYVASALGLFVSTYLALVEANAFPAPLSGFAALLAGDALFGLLAVAGLFVLRQVIVNYDETQKQLDRAEAAGGPAWARIPAKLLLAIAMIVFSSQVFHELEFDNTQAAIRARGISGCPRWMRILANLYTRSWLLLFFFPLILEYAGYLPADDGGFLFAMLSAGFGMFMCSSIFVRVYSSNVLAEKSGTG